MFKLEVGNLSVRTLEAAPSFPRSSAHLGRGPIGPRLMTWVGPLLPKPSSHGALGHGLLSLFYPHLPLELCLSLPLTFPRVPGEEALRMSTLIPLIHLLHGIPFNSIFHAIC